MTSEFAGKVVVVTGGSRGIGRGTAAAFAAEGARTVLAASSQANLEAAADAIAHSARIRPDICAVDLRREHGRKVVFDLVVERYGRCDILVNSAGATRAGAFLDLFENAWQDGFALKFFGCVSLCRLFWPLLTKRMGMSSTSSVAPRARLIRRS